MNQLVGQYIYKNISEFCITLADAIYDINKIQLRDHLMTKEKLRELFKQDLMSLYYSIVTERKEYFTNYLKWRRRVYETRLIPTQILRHNYLIFQDVLLMNCDISLEAILRNYLEAGLSVYDKMLDLPATYIEDSYEYSDLSKNYIDIVLKGDVEKANSLVYKELENTIPLEHVYTRFIKNIQYEIGRLWELNKISISQEHTATIAANNLILKANNLSLPPKDGKVVLAACLTRELHDMGLKVVSGYLGLKGYRTIFKGPNNTVHHMMYEIQNLKPDAMAISISMPIWVKSLTKLIREIKAMNHPVKIIVGGYLFLEDPDAYKLLGADGFSKDAEEAYQLLEQLI